MTELAESLVERGHQVTALASRGRYNGGETFSSAQEYRGIQIKRVWATSFGKRRSIGRLADYLSFYLTASLKLLFLPRHDIVMPLTTPPLIGLIALLIARLRGMHTVQLVQDVYPDVAVALGSLKPRNPITRLLNMLSRIALKGSDRVIALGECMRERIVAKGVDPARIDVIHNWADGSKIIPLETETNPFVKDNELKGRFVVLFSGNLGRVNDFSTVLEAARAIQDHDYRDAIEAKSQVLFLFIGEGTEAATIRGHIDQHKLENVRMLSYQPQEVMPFVLAAADVALVTLREGLAGLSVPSKTYAILAAGRPILFIGDKKSAIACIIEENACGAVVSSGDSKRLAQLINSWASDKTNLAQFNRAARTTFEKHFDRPRAAAAYVDAFTKCMETSHALSNTIPKLEETSP
ncbi:MAG: colanic acid biosynthesis glycosyl transferase WcaI [Acidobacteriota bacterium]|jgi:glycosyltransferase involved in cell wall biosynthesis|nr:colanic acid biosynthesis glycosyl transferase WcaI [Acidobacteriota bacterium]